MVLDKKFNLVLTKSTQADRSHFTAMEISVNPISSGVPEQREAPGGCQNAPNRVILVN